MELQTWESLEAVYKPKIIALADQVRKEMQEEGWNCSEVSAWTDEDLAVSFVYYPEGASPEEPKHSIDITFRLLDAQSWDGIENGTSFAVGVCEYGGLIVGGLHPYNYSSRVWVDPHDQEAVEERWREFAAGAPDANEIMYLIDQWRKRYEHPARNPRP